MGRSFNPLGQQIRDGDRSVSGQTIIHPLPVFTWNRGYSSLVRTDEAALGVITAERE